MPLDLSKLIGQIVDLAAGLKSKAGERQAKLEFALKTLKSSAADLDELKQKVESSKTTWLVAGLRDGLDIGIAAQRCPDDFIVLASDGSHIDIDRHQSAHCFLINIGMAQLQYGAHPDAYLSNFPSLYFKDSDMVITSADGHQIPIEGQLLGIKRGIEECRCLAERVKELDADLPVVSLLDGSLILWRLAEQVYPDFVVSELLLNGLLKHLSRLNQLCRGRFLAVASYISYPRSTEVVNLLRLAVCPHLPVDCDRCGSGKFEARPCDVVAGLLDRDLFNRLLAPGQRSALFGSRSSVVIKYYGANAVNFFYIKLDGEVARVEVPLWVAENENLLELVHSTLLDQCRRGLGYPVALSEAHEQAVVTVADRQQFWSLVEQVLVEDGIYPESSAKSESKRGRWI
jgi:hypothetical protein